MPLLEGPAHIPDAPEASEDPLQTGHRVFDEDVRKPLEGLALLGALTDEAKFAGHTFILRTLTVGERLIVAMLVKDYQETMGANLAYITAWVALSVQRVDNEHLPFPYKEEPGHAWANQRFNYVSSRWYKYTIDFLYSKCLELEAKAEEAVAEMAKTLG